MKKMQLIAALQAILPESAILSSKESQKPFECDGLSAYRQLPLLTVLPDTIEQIQAICKLCNQQQIPLVARGAGTGLSGGAMPHEEGILLNLAKFNQILSIDIPNRSVRVQPGVRNLAISEAVAQYGLYYAPDPSSQIACTIGGNVAENSGGVHCLKYGLTVHNILELKVVMADGELLTIGSQAYDSAGFDLLALMTGSEGLLGIIVEVTVKLLPKPERTQVILAAFDDVAKAGRAVADIIAAGIIPAGLEMMDKLAIQAAEAFVHAGYPLEAEAILLCEIDGNNEEVSEHIMKVHHVLENSDPISFATAESEQQRNLFWAGRKAAFPAVGRLSPDYYCMDGTIPKQHLAAVLQEIQRLSRHHELAVANVFHAGDGNLHPLILYDANNAGELVKAEHFGADILKLCVQAGGSITGEHGVGIEKIDQMCNQFATDELAQFHSVKAAFDPQGILNPGKAVPTLHRCAELGAMHVHHGELPHPELERF
ncbi:MAG: FAD-binding oxidoreductase [Methylophaga sp.]|jgi:glycolate oxidase|nr:FAD-binding oxidoreductase [Methylophaga sp.]MAY17947.1 FAD-binding oxidoreductase [Methylophaga sp.]HAO25164.1 FAD-binding oxidoreductase [Methylophaga sp.]|tara:strand:+ start:3279 stop:4733 length:1455 start_codon:yes stop_codon:yes gene_type:complete